MDPFAKIVAFLVAEVANDLQDVPFAWSRPPLDQFGGEIQEQRLKNGRIPLQFIEDMCKVYHWESISCNAVKIPKFLHISPMRMILALLEAIFAADFRAFVIKRLAKKMKKISLIALAFVAVSMAGCGGAPAPGNGEGSTDGIIAEVEAPKPVPVDYAAVFDSAMHGKQVIVEGYLQLPNMMYTSGNDAQVDFHARPNQHYGTSITANIETGDCKNCMAKLGEKYQLSDLKMKADDGTEVLGNQRVRLTGNLRVHSSDMTETGYTASLDVAKIEKIPEIDLDYSQMKVVTVTPENFLDTTLNYALSMVESKIGIPTMLFMENDVTLDMTVGGKRIGATFTFGTGPNQIEPIPANYSKSDFKIHDHKGNVINLNKPAKVYGTRSTPRKDSPGLLYVERIEQ